MYNILFDLTEFYFIANVVEKFHGIYFFTAAFIDIYIFGKYIFIIAKGK